MEEFYTVEQAKNRQKAAHLAPWQYKKGQSGNPKGRYPTKSLKEYAKEQLSKMTDEEREEFFHGLSKETIWKMAEGNPKNDLDFKGHLSISDLLDNLDDRPTTAEQTMASESSIQDQKQIGAVDEVQAQQDAGTLQQPPA